jgi:hypothetical protein
MLEYIEALLKELRQMRADSEAIVLNGTITDMERYRFMMGRLEGLKLAGEMQSCLTVGRRRPKAGLSLQKRPRNAHNWPLSVAMCSRWVLLLIWTRRNSPPALGARRVTG